MEINLEGKTNRLEKANGKGEVELSEKLNTE